MSLNKLLKIASNFENKYKLAGHGLGSISPGSGYRGYTGPIKDSKFNQIKDFALITIPEFESFLKEIVPALKEMQKQYLLAEKRGLSGESSLEELASMEGIDWKWTKINRNQPIPQELEIVMLKSLMNVGPLQNYFTKIASSKSINFIAAKLAAANEKLAFFQKLKEKAKSFFGGKKMDYEEIPETEEGPLMSPGISIDLERKKVFDLEDKLKDLMSYIDKYISLYKNFYSNPTLEKCKELIRKSSEYYDLYDQVKTDISQLNNLVNPSEKDIELDFFGSSRSLEDKSNMTSIMSYLMKDPELNDPNNIRRALTLYRILEDKLSSVNAL